MCLGGEIGCALVSSLAIGILRSLDIHTVATMDVCILICRHWEYMRLEIWMINGRIMRLALRPDNRRWHHIQHALLNCADCDLLRLPSLGPQQLREDLLAAAAGQFDAVSAMCAEFCWCAGFCKPAAHY